MARPHARRILVPAIALALGAGLACKPESSATPAGPSAPGGGGPATSAPPPVPLATGTVAYVSVATLLRRDPTDARKVASPGGKEVANVLATLQRGEKVTPAEGAARRIGDDEWVKVRTSDDREGWLKRSALLEGEGITEATVLAQADVFDRPDLLAANAGRKIEPATLLLVVKAKAPFSEVSVSSGPNAWVLTDRLATGEVDVSIAKLAEKARFLKKSGKGDEAAQILAFARSQFPGAPLLEAMAAQLGEAPLEGAAAGGGEKKP